MSEFKYFLSIELLEDLHIGSGLGGKNYIDSINQRDKDGYPCIPSSHLKGILRDIAWDYKELATRKEKDYFMLFGKKPDVKSGGIEDERGRIVVTTFYLKERAGKKAEDFFKEESHTSIEIDRKVSKEDTLRTIELIKTGTVFEGYITIPTECDSYFKTFITKVNKIGHSKTRSGAIKVICDIADRNNDDSILKNLKTDKLRLIIKNFDSVCLPSLSNYSNIIFTESFIRAQRLTGAFVQYLINKNGDTDIVFKNMIISNGYPMSKKKLKEIKSVIPMPLSVNTLKNSDNTQGVDKDIPHWLHKIKKKYIDLLKDGKGDAKVSRPKDNDYLTIYDDFSSGKYSPEIKLQMRNQIKDKETELFSEEQICENCCFAFDIEFKNGYSVKNFIADFKELLTNNSYLRIGRGGKAFEIIDIADTKEGTKIPSDKDCYLIMRSDIILRDELLRFYSTIDNENIEKIEELGERIKIEDNSFVETERITGFNAASKALKNPKIAMKKGSVIKIKTNENIESEIKIGEERDNGFGEIFFIGCEDFEKIIINLNGIDNQHSKTESAKSTREDKYKKLQDLKDKLTNISISHLNWLYNEVYNDKSEDSEKIIKTISDKSKKLGGKDLKNVGTALEGIDKSISKEDFMLSIRMKLIDLKKRTNDE